MLRPQCQGLQGVGEMKLSTLIATLLSWVRVPKQRPCVSMPSLVPLELRCVHLIKTFLSSYPPGDMGSRNVVTEMVREGE